MKQENIGAFVANLRKDKGWTQKELASKLCVSDKTISKWETGKGLPDMGMLIPLSEALGVTIDELLSGGGRSGDTTDGIGDEPNKVIIEYAEKTIKRTKKNYRLIPAGLLGILILTAVILSALGYSFGLNTEPEDPLKGVVERNPMNTVAKAVLTDKEQALTNFANGAGGLNDYLSYRLPNDKKLSSLGLYIFDGDKWSSDQLLTHGESQSGLISFGVTRGETIVGLYDTDGSASFSVKKSLDGFQESWDTLIALPDRAVELPDSGTMMLYACVAVDGSGVISNDVFGKSEEQWLTERSVMEKYAYVVALYMTVE